ncbi:MAG: DUF3320 domain-containing protein [Deltaproteobacteria bacterium]|nr:MAG: DUF3320 domain-containing protein [Deltaproteobacteria bacterium]
MEHARSHPELTLGVAAFGLPQAEAIRQELEVLRHGDPSCEEFFASHDKEPFFVKNLENVQGDERDVIFISIGYGRAADGTVSMNFGPLNQQGGERRLNVLITRARRRCEVFSNLRADDIDLSRTQARGVAALKSFLQYAEAGTGSARAGAGDRPASILSKLVAEGLRGLGYEVRHGVGSGQTGVELAVVDPRRSDRYLLAIETDGDVYAGARWARDRERLRTQVLESLGWKVYRLWSAEWFKDPQRELERIARAIEEAKNEGDGPEQSTGCRKASTEGHGALHVQNVSSALAGTADEDKPCSYRLARIDVNMAGRPLHEMPVDRLVEYVVQVVEQESPVHRSDAVSRIVHAAGMKRAGEVTVGAIEKAIAKAQGDGLLVVRGEFLWRPGMKMPPVRDRRALAASRRCFERIAPEEIARAVELVVRAGAAVPPDEAVTAACRMLGFSRPTDDYRKAAGAAVDTLLASGRLRKHGHFLVAAERRTAKAG